MIIKILDLTKNITDKILFKIKEINFNIFYCVCMIMLSSLCKSLCKEAKKINSEIFCNKSYIKIHKKFLNRSN